MSDIWSRIFYDPNDLEKRTKIITDFEQNESIIKQFRQPERSGVDESLFKWFKQRIRDYIKCNFYSY